MNGEHVLGRLALADELFGVGDRMSSAASAEM